MLALIPYTKTILNHCYHFLIYQVRKGCQHLQKKFKASRLAFQCVLLKINDGYKYYLSLSN